MAKSMFANVKTIGAPKSAAKKSAREEVTIANLRQYAELKALQASIASVLGTIEAEIKDEAFDMFVDKIEATHKAPGSFDGVDGVATVNIQMRKRGTNSPLGENEVEFLKSLNLPVHEEVAAMELYAINPSYMYDEKLLVKVTKLLQDKVPEDFIVKQEKKAKMVVSAETLEKVMAMASPNRDAIKLVTSLALKPKLAVTDIDAILDNVKDMLIEAAATADSDA